MRLHTRRQSTAHAVRVHPVWRGENAPGCHPGRSEESSYASRCIPSQNMTQCDYLRHPSWDAPLQFSAPSSSSALSACGRMAAFPPRSNDRDPRAGDPQKAAWNTLRSQPAIHLLIMEQTGSSATTRCETHWVGYAKRATEAERGSNGRKGWKRTVQPKRSATARNSGPLSQLTVLPSYLAGPLKAW